MLIADYSKDLAKKMDEVVQEGQSQGWAKEQYQIKLKQILQETRFELRQGKVQLNKNFREIKQ